MTGILEDLLKRLDGGLAAETPIVPWASPIPFFGEIGGADLATLGLNPSNLEFCDEQGKELDAAARRFHTLGSLGLKRWSMATGEDKKGILDRCRRYFEIDGNPYSRWFEPLDEVISETGHSFYRRPEKKTAVHLDLVPFATMCKWSELGAKRENLLALGEGALFEVLRDSNVRVLVLNGAGVVKHFEDLLHTRLEREAVPAWTLNWKNGPRPGFAFKGTVHELSGRELGRTISIVGYSHNIQGTPGTQEIRKEIGRWIRDRIGL